MAMVPAIQVATPTLALVGSPKMSLTTTGKERYSILAAAAALGRSVKTWRRWEARGWIDPARERMPSPSWRGRQRLFSPADLERFEAVAAATGLPHHRLRGRALRHALDLTRRPRPEGAGDMTSSRGVPMDADDLVVPAMPTPGMPVAGQQQDDGDWTGYRYRYAGYRYAGANARRR
jgi:hypothetical protein